MLLYNEDICDILDQAGPQPFWSVHIKAGFNCRWAYTVCDYDPSHAATSYQKGWHLNYEVD